MFDIFYQNALAYKEALEMEIAQLEEQLKYAPQGELFVFRDKASHKWRIHTETKTIYLPQKQIQQARIFAQKKRDIARLEDLKHELREINRYLQLRKENPNQAAKISNDPRYQALLTSPDQQDWANETYEQCPLYPENKIHSTPSGILVRSKSESMIATLLHLNHIPYRYEQTLYLGTHPYYPDFTIKHPVTGKIYYWEHVGKMDNPTYRDSAYRKLYIYSQHQIHFSGQLITTIETKDVPLTTQKIQSKINEYFLAA